MEQIIKNSRKQINAWCSYDAANSVYNLVIISALFPIYYSAVTESAFGGAFINIFGFTIKNTVLYDYTIALGYFITILLTPMLSGIADMGGYRKRFMAAFAILGAVSCSSFYFFTGSNIGFGIFLIITAVVGWAGSFVYYNSFLPIIATPDQHNRISARGWAWGYIGSMILLLFCIVMIETYQKWNFSNKLEALRFSFVLVGIWWIGVGQFAFYHLKEYKGSFTFRTHLLRKGFEEIALVFRLVMKQKVMNVFLISFFFLSMGVQTVMLVATLFGSVELGISGDKLIVTIFLIQILGIVGSFFFSWLSNQLGNFLSLSIMLAVWAIICLSAYFVNGAEQFYVLAALVGMVMGGIQSQSRSTYARLIPENTTDTASYFTFYDITEKIGIVFGIFSFGVLEHMTGNMRMSTVLLSGYFIISFIFMIYTYNKFKSVLRG